MVQNKELAKAVAAIPQRSEKQSDTQKLIEAFVDPGILPQIENINSQIIYGRRGTGKTHVLKVLESSLRRTKATCVVYMDARTFGSTSQFSDPNVPLPSRCTSLFRDLLGEVYNGLLDFVVQQDGPDVDSALEQLDRLGNAATEPVAQTKKDSETNKQSEKSGTRTGLEARVAGTAPSINATFSVDKTGESETASTYRFEYSDKVIFPSVSSAVRETLKPSTLASTYY